MTKRHDIAIQHSSKRSDWRTPRELYDALDQEFGFEVDVAADAMSSLCETWYGPDQSNPWKDGLTVDWYKDTVEHVAFMNPPYRRGDSKADPPVEPIPIEPWIEKAWTESQKGMTVVGPLPFSPQTEWYRRYVMGHIVGVHDVEQSGTYTMPREGWTCFHCGEVFTTEPAAREHFGAHPTAHRWMGHAAMEVRQLPYRVTFIDPDTGTTAANAPGNTAVVIWKPNPGYVGPWQPTVRYWSYR